MITEEPAPFRQLGCLLSPGATGGVEYQFRRNVQLDGNLRIPGIRLFPKSEVPVTKGIDPGKNTVFINPDRWRHPADGVLVIALVPHWRFIPTTFPSKPGRKNHIEVIVTVGQHVGTECKGLLFPVLEGKSGGLDNGLDGINNRSDTSGMTGNGLRGQWIHGEDRFFSARCW